MSEKCEKCGGGLAEGSITSMYGVFFYLNETMGKLKSKRSAIVCSCCKKCGHLQDFKVKELEKLQ